MLCKLQRYSNGLHKAYEDHSQYKNLTDEQRARIEGEAYLQTLDSGKKGGIPANDGRSLQESIGETEKDKRTETGTESETVTDESTGKSTGIHENKVNVDEGEPAGTVQ